ncbi:Uma2 family endonuclease [Scytonema sp. NUACC26]|uniref:Uma2 family endonuclease n=1 Tax=Scytonema sp. NUACC26 TaxID=3140176 RepID=UPI0034DBD2D8
MTALTLQLPSHLKLTDEEFEQIVTVNKELRLELTAEGELVIMAPTGGETGTRNFDLLGQLWFWNSQKNLGIAFDSSTGFKLPNGATRSPDASWLRMERWNSLTLEQRKKFIPLCPDFAVELVSETDDVEETKAKMQEYLENGLQLGWLINPKDKQVVIYRHNRSPEILQAPKTLSGEDILPGFILNLQTIFT